MAHNGVLFLDELSEFKKHVLEVLRQPLEDMRVTISRASSTITYPSSFMLVAAMNPCPCGYLADSKHECRCTYQQIHRYRSKISGPLLDRIDIHVEVPAVPYKDMKSSAVGEASIDIRERVCAARRIQAKRFGRAKIFCNAQMNSRHIKIHGVVDDDCGAYNRILKIARTIADLENKADIKASHVAEAIQYRSLDRVKHFI